MKCSFHLLGCFFHSLDFNDHRPLWVWECCRTHFLHPEWCLSRSPVSSAPPRASALLCLCDLPHDDPLTHPDTLFYLIREGFLWSREKSLSQVQIDYIYCLGLPKCPVTPLEKEIKLTWHSWPFTRGGSWLSSTASCASRWLQID